MHDLNSQTLSKALQQLRLHTLHAFECYLNANQQVVPQQSGFNPPVWELGHVAWFQELWVARNPQRSQGIAFDHSRPFKASCLEVADAWFDSAKVAHATRWHLPHLTAQESLRYADETLKQTLNCLATESDNSPALYFYWLALQHEAMHLEASAYMAQSLGMPFQALWQQAPHDKLQANLEGASTSTSATATATATMASQHWTLGADAESPFCFDNELSHRTCLLPAFEISLQPVSWAQYLNFVTSTGHPLPRYVRKIGTHFEVKVFDNWQPLNTSAPAVHLSWHDAQAYCAWAHCRLPTEAEWDCAAKTSSGFEWGQVWEWTQDSFAPYEGFVVHPYKEYSAPWFGTHKVLRGASHLAHPALRRVNYRNFFTPERDDIYAGFRTCALSADRKL